MKSLSAHSFKKVIKGLGISLQQLISKLPTQQMRPAMQWSGNLISKLPTQQMRPAMQRSAHLKKELPPRKITLAMQRAAYLLIGITLLFSCKRQEITLSTTTDVNITGYFEQHRDQFSEFEKILERSGTASFLGAYGKYTVFAPTNAAVKVYLESIGKSSLDQVDPALLKDLVRFHTINDTVSTAFFKDGKLQQLTMYGQYLLTGAAFTNGVTRYTINRQASITEANIRTGNGIIHVLDKVLTPASKTLAQMIESDPKYSIFSEALKATKFYDSLNVLPANQTADTTKRFLTLIAETDDVFRQAGISSFEQLKQRYSKTGNPTSHTDSLWLFVAYRISPGARYLADIVTASSHPTLAPQEIITSKLSGQAVLINDDEFNGVREPGYEVNRAGSDNTAQNGVLHTVNKSYAIKIRQPTPLYWDVADQPELMKLTSFRRAGSESVSIGTKTSLLSGVVFGNSSATQDNTYNVDGAAPSNAYANNDVLSLSFGGTSARQQWMEFTTPMIIKGRYKVWICYRQNGSGANIQAIMDFGTPQEQVMPNIASWATYLTGIGVALADVNSDNLLEAQGYKRYAANYSLTGGNHVGRLMGTVNITTTDKHTIRLNRVGGRDGSRTTTLDMIQFIPVEMDQQYPRFYRDGTRMNRP